MKRIFARIKDFFEYCSFFIFKPEPLITPPVSDENWLLQKIEPVINSQELTDTQKIEILKKIIENYDPLEY